MNEKEKWAENQLTEEQAIKLAESEIYKNWTPEQVVRFQLFQKKLCMDFSYFHECITKVLGRSVFTHEFGFRDNLVQEYLGSKPTPTLEEIINLIPEEKRIVIEL